VVPVFESYILDRPDARIHYWIGGPPDAQLMVFSHGATIDQRTWNPQLGFADHYRVLIYDIRGHGSSEPSRVFQFADAVGDLVALIDAVATAPVVLVGESMGGNLSQAVAYLQPVLVRALVLADCACNTWPLTRLERRSAKFWIALLRVYPSSVLTRQMANQSSIVPSVRAYLREVAGSWRTGESLAVLESLFDGLNPYPHYRAPMPELLIRGDSDRLGNCARVMPLWRQRDPHARYVVLLTRVTLPTKTTPLPSMQRSASSSTP
jgi:3-oxoadipate enol-lactonase